MTNLKHEAQISQGGLSHERLLRLKYLLDKLVTIAIRPPEQVIVSPELEAELLIEELKSVSNPFEQLDYALELHDELPKPTVEQELNPLVASLSHDTLDFLVQEEEEAHASRRISLGTSNALTCIRVWDRYRTDETEQLAVYAIDHTGDTSGSTGRSPASHTYSLAFEKAKLLELPFDEALDAVNTEAMKRLGDDHRYEYPFLYDPNVSPLDDRKYQYSPHRTSIDA